MGVKLTPRDIDELKGMGYSEQEVLEAVREIEMEELQGSYGQVQQQRGRDPRYNSQTSAFSSKYDESLIRWQLELNDILERAEHILRGDIPKFIDGQIIWENNPNANENPLNNTGVQEIMKILAMYVNRNTILSDYSNDEINLKVYDAGREINNLLFMRYDDFGMDTEEKKKSYPIITREMIDIIHSAYKRALDGAEKRSLREMINVNQSTSMNSNTPNVSINNQGTGVRERGILNPMRFIRGRYV